MARRKLVLIGVTAAVAILAAALCGCGTTGGASTSASTSPPPPSATPASLAATPTSADFGSVLVGTTASRTIVLTNSGGTAATITAVNMSDPSFGVPSLALPATVAPSGSLAVSITFSPSSASSVTGTVSFISNASNSPTAVPVSGSGTTGVVAQIAASPAVIDFGSITVNTTATRTLTISNAGTATLTVSSAAVSGAAFSITGTTFPVAIPASGSTNVSVRFAPVTTGNFTGTITLASNATNQISPVGLSGTATAPPNPLLSVSPTSLSFGQVATGASSSQSVTLTNTGNATVNISAANVIGSAFSVGGITLPKSVAPGASTTASIGFAPQGTGGASGSVSFVSNANNSPAVVSVSGSGFTPVAHFVDLNWNPSISVVNGYRVYRSTQSGGGYQLVSSSLVPTTTFSDGTVQSGQTYFYVVTAVDALGAESIFSNEATAAVPIP